MTFITVFNRYWGVVLASGTLLSLLFSFSYEFYSIKYTIKSSEKSLMAEHHSMKAYVDAKDKTTNVRIDDLSRDVEKMHEDIVASNARIDATLAEIVESQKQVNNYIQEMNNESNHRLDEIMLLIDNKRTARR